MGPAQENDLLQNRIVLARGIKKIQLLDDERKTLGDIVNREYN